MRDQLPEGEKIGQLLLQEGLINEQELQWALSLQVQRAPYKLLGEILRECGIVTREAFHEILRKYRKQIPLGQLLVKMAVVSDYQLSQALKAQENSRQKLGQILVEMKFVTRNKLVECLCVQLGISGIDLGVDLPDKQLLNKVSAVFLKTKRVMPFRYNAAKQILTVLMEDPTDKETISDLAKVFQTSIEPAMLITGPVDRLLDGLLDIWQPTE